MVAPIHKTRQSRAQTGTGGSLILEPSTLCLNLKKKRRRSNSPGAHNIITHNSPAPPNLAPFRSLLLSVVRLLSLSPPLPPLSCLHLFRFSLRL